MRAPCRESNTVWGPADTATVSLPGNEGPLGYADTKRVWISQKKILDKSQPQGG